MDKTTIAKTKDHPDGWPFVLCKNPNFEMLQPPGVVFSVKGVAFSARGAFFNRKGFGIFSEGVTVVFMPINT